jgi:C-terminal domain of 1-Cys peroxiredoxin
VPALVDDEQLVRDLAVASPLGDEGQDLDLSLRQAELLGQIASAGSVTGQRHAGAPGELLDLVEERSHSQPERRAVRGYMARLLVYPMTTGRNFDEVLRVIDSLQLTANHKVATPANWKRGDDVIISGSVTDEQARELFGEWQSPRPYIRIVPQPREREPVA